jgi:hypothetical protein
MIFSKIIDFFVADIYFDVTLEFTVQMIALIILLKILLFFYFIFENSICMLLVIDCTLVKTQPYGFQIARFRSIFENKEKKSVLGKNKLVPIAHDSCHKFENTQINNYK